MLVFLFILNLNFAQNQEKNDSSKINIKVDSNTVKGISVDTLDSFLVKKNTKTGSSSCKELFASKI